MNSIVEIILTNLAQLMPWRIVLSYQRAVRWTFGEKPRELGPGFHWCLWVVHQIETVTVVETVMDLPTQSVTTSDGVSVCFSVNIGQIVTDAVKHFCEVQDFTESTRGLAMTHLAKAVRKMTFDEAHKNQDKLENSLLGTLSTKWKRWGTEATHVGFKDFVRVDQQIRLFGDSAAAKVTA